MPSPAEAAAAAAYDDDVVDDAALVAEAAAPSNVSGWLTNCLIACHMPKLCNDVPFVAFATAAFCSNDVGCLAALPPIAFDATDDAEAADDEDDVYEADG